MRILLLTRYSRLGASSRLRTLQHVPALQSAGFSVDVSPLLDDRYLERLYGGRRRLWTDLLVAYLKRCGQLLRGRGYDLLWIEKELFPWFPAGAETLLERLGIPYVVDYDDALFHRYDLHANRFVRALLGGKIDAVMRHSALVVAGNTYLAERAENAGARRVEIVPTVVDVQRYSGKDLNADSPFVVGWIGTPRTAKYLELVQPALSELSKKKDVLLRLIGAGEIALPGVRTEVLPWSEDTEVQRLKMFHVGIMPLVDAPWERGKCGYKLIQYMASSLPVVASPVGMNCELVRPGENGYLAQTHTEWFSALEALMRDPDRRQVLGRRGRELVEAQYSLPVASAKLVELFTGLGSGTGQHG